MNEQPQESDAMEQARDAKQEYHTPELRDYGKMREVTNFSPNSGPNIDYISDYATAGY